MKNVNLNNQVFKNHTEIMNATAFALEKDENVISANYNGEYIQVHELDEDGQDDQIQWYCEQVNYNQDSEGSVKSVDIDC